MVVCWESGDLRVVVVVGWVVLKGEERREIEREIVR